MEISNSKQAFQFLSFLQNREQEEFWALALNARKELIEPRMIFKGTVDQCPVHPREIFRFAMTVNASSLVVAHNHPTGKPLPSNQDVLFTRKLVKASQFMEIPVVDHLIVAADGYCSLAQQKIIS